MRLGYVKDKWTGHCKPRSLTQNTSVQTGVGFSPPRSVNLPFFHLGLLKGRFLAADSSSSSPNVVVVCCLLFVCDQVRKLLANCLITAT